MLELQPMILLRLSTAWLCGIALAAWLQPAPLALIAGGTAAGCVWCAAAGWRIGARSGRAIRQIAAFGLCLALGAARYHAAMPDLGPDHIAARNGRGRAELIGRIVAEPDRRDGRTDYRVAAESLHEDAWRPVHGLVLVQAPRHPPHAYGETVLITGELIEPPVLEDFDYRAYLARQGVHSLVRRARIETLGAGGGNPLRRRLIALRDRARRSLAASLPEPEASLVTGIVLGDARGIPAGVAQAFRTTNTTHIIAISGSNIAVLVGLLTATLGRLLGRRRAAPAILIALGLYSLLVGADAAVVRAAIMGGLAVVAGYLHRPGHAATALFAAAWAMTAYDPLSLWDIGFQLSFAATLGLILFSARFADTLRVRLERHVAAERARAVVGLVNEAVLVTLAAQITTWPIIAYHIGQVSLVGLAANFLILPAQPAVMVLGGLAALVGMVAEPLGRLAGMLAWLPTAYTIRVVEAMARVPYAAVELRLSGAPVLAYYGALGMAVLPWRRVVDGGAILRGLVERLSGPARFGPRPPTSSPKTAGGGGKSARLEKKAAAALGGLAALCGLVWTHVYFQPDGLLHVYQLDVGQGDAILVVTPNGRRMLVDGGPGPSAVLSGLGRHAAPWDRRLDLVVPTHPDADHIGGLPAVLDRYQVGFVVDPEIPADTPDAAAWSAARARAETQTVRARADGTIVLDEAAGVTAAILWPPPDLLPGEDGAPATNDNSVVLRLSYGVTSVLLTGDIEARAEELLLGAQVPLAADVLKVAHHGSGGSSSLRFVQAVGPRLALIGVGGGNRYGHPDSATLARLDGIEVRRTDRDGEIEVISDGEGVWVR